MYYMHEQIIYLDIIYYQCVGGSKDLTRVLGYNYQVGPVVTFDLVASINLNHKLLHGRFN